MTIRQEPETEVAELGMLRFAMGVTGMDSEYIKGTGHVGQLENKGGRSEMEMVWGMLLRSEE